jgi:hypothetical protein
MVLLWMYLSNNIKKKHWKKMLSLYLYLMKLGCYDNWRALLVLAKWVYLSKNAIEQHIWMSSQLQNVFQWFILLITYLVLKGEKKKKQFLF